MIGTKLLDLHGPRFEIVERPVSVASSAEVPRERGGESERERERRSRGKAGRQGIRHLYERE